ncbi:rhodanese-like domain-containing protein [Nocardioides sp. Kera G14]|uniref:rhodanese-like domain-containing protein n=1 Tax=Nocardioides sp. Kera G14 TaxID=2884264 RepID=UPI001D0F8393|nr:rhodanese-like domain-containing protein [Nocardioides sp. Kera G14]UDY23060.1 hypothetical protein LH076_13455 [Nocardioides sp. Kera G14]
MVGDGQVRSRLREVCVTDLEEIAAAHRTLYRFDVRTSCEYAAGHLPGFAHVPVARLVGEIEAVAPDRSAPVLLSDDDGARATLVAARLESTGRDVWVVAASPADLFERGA